MIAIAIASFWPLAGGIALVPVAVAAFILVCWSALDALEMDEPATLAWTAVFVAVFAAALAGAIELILS